jgi:hypothetical protein
MLRRARLLWIVGLVAIAANAGSAQVPARSALDDDQRLVQSLAALQPQRPGLVDAYVVVAALDTDPVFGRAGGDPARVLGSRFDG